MCPLWGEHLWRMGQVYGTGWASAPSQTTQLPWAFPMEDVSSFQLQLSLTGIPLCGGSDCFLKGSAPTPSFLEQRPQLLHVVMAVPFVSYSSQVSFMVSWLILVRGGFLRPHWLIQFRLERDSFLRSRVAYPRIMPEEEWLRWELWQKLDVSCEHISKLSPPSFHKVKCRSYLVLWSKLSQWFKEAPLPVLSGGNKK